MDNIEIEVIGNRAAVVKSLPLVAGSVGLPVVFSFDQAWQGLDKTAVFRVNGKTMDYVNLQTQATIPWELLTSPGCRVMCGVYGCSADGQLQLPTVWVELGVIQPGADPSGDVEAQASLPIWQQLTQDISLALDHIIAIEQQIINGVDPLASEVAQ